MWLLSQNSLAAFFFSSKSPPSLTTSSPHGLSDLTAWASPLPLLHPTLASCWFVDMPHVTFPTSGPWYLLFPWLGTAFCWILSWPSPFPFRSLLNCHLTKQAISNNLLKKSKHHPLATHTQTFPSYPTLLFSACFSHLFNIYLFCSLSLSHLKYKFCPLCLEFLEQGVAHSKCSLQYCISWMNEWMNESLQHHTGTVTVL